MPKRIEITKLQTETQKHKIFTNKKEGGKIQKQKLRTLQLEN